MLGEGVTEIGPSLEPREFPPFRLGSMVLSTDGGLTAEPMPGQDLNDLCYPEYAAFVPAGLYVAATCEHTAQLWKITFNKGGSLVDAIHFTYWDGDGDDKFVPGPFMLAVSDDTVLMPAHQAPGPALMTDDPKTGLLKTVWQSEKKEEWIKSADFRGAEGLMLMNTGQVLASSDSGRSWQERGKVPADLQKERARVKIGRGREDLIVIIPGQTLLSGDGGATWTREINPVNLDPETIVVNETMAAAADDPHRRRLWVRKLGGGTWSKIESPEGRINDISLAGGKLFVLVEGELYYTDAEEVVSSEL